MQRNFCISNNASDDMKCNVVGVGRAHNLECRNFAVSMQSDRHSLYRVSWTVTFVDIVPHSSPIFLVGRLSDAKRRQHWSHVRTRRTASCSWPVMKCSCSWSWHVVKPGRHS